MNISYESLKSMLKQAGVQPTSNRIKVLDYIISQETHPNAEQIFKGISAQEPMLSRATVYNALNALTRAELLRELTITEGETRYDAILETHGHFRCTACGTIHNFSFNIDAIPFTGLEGFSITGKDVYFKGLCPNCQSPVQTEKEKNG